MSALTMPSSPYPYRFPHDLAYNGALSEPLPRPHERVSLPSIRQAIPEFQRQTQQDYPVRISSSAGSSTGGSFTGVTTPPEYIHSPTHHTGLLECRNEIGRTNSIPRLCTGSSETTHHSTSPSVYSGTGSDAWGRSTRTSSPTRYDHIPCVQSSRRPEPHGRAEAHSTLPSLSLPRFERERSDIYVTPSFPGDDRAQEPHRRLRTHSSASYSSYEMEERSPYRPATHGYSLHHPNRVQSLSLGSAHPLDRPSMFSPIPSPAPYGPGLHESLMRAREFSMAGNYEGKQRKRRGNLPKETTDKLRAWFVAHLHHPYPSEEEKQELMRETGLQLNQISNWFINARRRQLPTILSNARAESDVTTGRGAESNLLSSSERSDYDPDIKPRSDGESDAFRDSDLESIKRRRVTRGSI